MRPSISSLLALATLICVGCVGKKEPSGLRIAVVPKGTTHEFWNAVHAGAVQAEHDLRGKGYEVEVQWRGPMREDDRDYQIQIVETFATTGIDGIVLAPLDETALVGPVEMAAKAEIPVVIIDSGIDTESYASFVATDNLKGGRMAGEHLTQLLQGNGNVVLFRYQEGSASTSKREQGFLDAINAAEGMTIVASKDYGGATVDAAYTKAESMLKRLQTEGTEVGGIFCPNETTTVALTKALREMGWAGGKVKVIGFDTGRQSLVDMENGDLQGLIVQNPFRMGYRGVIDCVKKIQGQEVERRVDTGVVLVTKENMRNAEVQKLLNPPVDAILKGNR